MQSPPPTPQSPELNITLVPLAPSLANTLLVISVRGRERLRDELLVKNEIQEREVRLVGVRGCVAVWNEGWGATNAIELQFKESKCVRVKSGVVLPVEDIGGGIC